MTSPEDRVNSVSYCSRCGEQIFVAMPGHTTKEEIVAFASRAKFLKGSSVVEDEWIHPGKYCPNGCEWEWWNLGSGDLWEKLERERKERETASILVRLVTPHATTLDAIKLYLDRDIRNTASRDEAPANCEYIEVEPGLHTLIARDYEHTDPHRRESNRIEFTIRENEHLVFSVGEEKDKLFLVQEKSLEKASGGEETSPSVEDS